MHTMLVHDKLTLKSISVKFCYTIKRAVSRERTVSFSEPCQDTGFWLNEDSLGGRGRIFMRPKTCIETRQGKSNCPLARNRTFNCITLSYLDFKKMKFHV